MGRFALLLICWVMVAAWACGQPAADETWLNVVVLKQDGTPNTLPAYVQAWKVQGNQRTPAGRIIATEAGRVSIAGLDPGDYEIELSITALGWLAAPRAVTIAPGANQIEWRLPATQTVRVSFSQGDQTDRTPTRMIGSITPARRPMPLTVNLQRLPQGYRLAELLPGTYRLLLVTDLGYIDQQLTITDAPPAQPIPLPLQEGAVLVFAVTNQFNEEVPQANISLNGQLAPSIPLNLTCTTDTSGHGRSLSLPPGMWRWNITRANYAAATGSRTVKEQGEVTVNVSMVKR